MEFSERAGQRKPGTCILQRPRPTISPFGTGTIASVDGVGKEPSRTARSACFAVRTAEICLSEIAPAILVAVTHGDKLLMTRYQGRAYKGYALIAGFTEIGETAEDTVRREVMEEVGLRVKDIRYYGSQPWGMDSNLLMGFYARLDGEAEIHMDRQELSQAGWYRRDEISLRPDGYSLTNHMIQAFLRGDWQ